MREKQGLRPLGARYIQGLDGLRAAAVLTVVAAHAGMPHTPGGKTGVVLFFVISGYLITSILLRERIERGTISLKRFYANRALRLLPAMLIATTAYLGLSILLAPSSQLARDALNAIPAAYFHFLNWWNVAVHPEGLSAAGYLGHYWSLAVEEQFYVLWPLVLMAAYRFKGSGGVMWAAFVGAALSYAAKWLFVADAVRQTGTDLSADALLLGCGLAILIQRHPELIAKVAGALFFPAVGVLALALLFGHGESSASITEAAVYSRLWWPASILASAVLVAACVARTVPVPALRLLEWGPVAYVGRISYGLYLWHQVPLQGLNAVWDTDGIMSLVKLVIVTALSIGIAAASYHWVERRFLRMKLKAPTVPAPLSV